MKLQFVDEKNEKIRLAFETLKTEHPERLRQRLNISFSNWVFGLEELEQAAERYARHDVQYIELGGDYGGEDVGYQADFGKTQSILKEYGIKCSGICGFYSHANTLSTNNNFVRQVARDYIIEETNFCKAIGGTYLLVVPGTVGTSQTYDESDFYRSAATLRSVADVFLDTGVLCAVEPINAAEVSLCPTVQSVIDYIAEVDHPGVQHINGDIYHMICGETHVGEAILAAGDRLINLHLADSNRMPLGRGMMDVDTIIRALYLIGYNAEGRFVTGEPLGMAKNSYAAMYGRKSEQEKDTLLGDLVDYFREREEELLA